MFQYAFLVCAGLTTVYYLAFVSQLTSANTVESQVWYLGGFVIRSILTKLFLDPVCC